LQINRNIELWLNFLEPFRVFVRHGIVLEVNDIERGLPMGVDIPTLGEG
jgi:hypothetical protein